MWGLLLPGVLQLQLEPVEVVEDLGAFLLVPQGCVWSASLAPR